MMRGGREKNSVCCQIILRLMLRRSHCFDALEGDPSLSERVGLRCKENFNFRYTASQCVVSTLMKLISWQISNICRAEVQRGRSEEWFRPPAGRTHRDSSEWILTGSPGTNQIRMNYVLIQFSVFHIFRCNSNAWGNQQGKGREEVHLWMHLQLPAKGGKHRGGWKSHFPENNLIPLSHLVKTWAILWKTLQQNSIRVLPKLRWLANILHRSTTQSNRPDLVHFLCGHNIIKFSLFHLHSFPEE